MFRTVVLAPDPEFGKAVERLALESRHLLVNKTIEAFPENGYDVGRVISSYGPEIVLVENVGVDVTLKVSEKLRSYAPDVAVLALGGQVTTEVERQFEAMGATAGRSGDDGGGASIRGNGRLVVERGFQPAAVH